MKNWKPIVGACAIFLLGMIAGGLITAKAIQMRIRNAIRGGPDALEALVVDRMSSVLGLDATQKDKLRMIARDSHGQLKKLRQQVDPQAQEVLTKTEIEIRAILTPEQKEKFDKLVAERRAAWGELKK